jgi:hypothetical protein
MFSWHWPLIPDFSQTGSQLHVRVCPSIRTIPLRNARAHGNMKVQAPPYHEYTILVGDGVSASSICILCTLISLLFHHSALERKNFSLVRIITLSDVQARLHFNSPSYPACWHCPLPAYLPARINKPFVHYICAEARLSLRLRPANKHNRDIHMHATMTRACLVLVLCLSPVSCVCLCSALLS